MLLFFQDVSSQLWKEIIEISTYFSLKFYKKHNYILKQQNKVNFNLNNFILSLICVNHGGIRYPAGIGGSLYCRPKPFVLKQKVSR